MAEQTYTLHYLGCSVLSKGTTGLGVIQKPLKELYFSFRKKQTKTPVEVYMQITREGLNMLTPDGTSQGHQLKSTLYKFQQVSYVEAVQFTSKNNNRKTQFAFMPLNEKRAVSSPEKLFSTLEKKNTYLLSMNHQPIVVCLMRRQAGVKALDCHVFISLSATDAMKIVDSFSKMQQECSQNEYKGDFRALPPKHNMAPPGNPWDGGYRSDYRPYSDQGYPAPGMPDSNYPHDGRYQLRDEHFRGNSGPDRSPKVNDQPMPAAYGMMQHPNTNHPMAAIAAAAAAAPGPGPGQMQNYPPRGYGDIQERGRPMPPYFGQPPSSQPPPHQPPISSSSSSHSLPVNHFRGGSYEDRVRDYQPDPRYNHPRYEQPPPPSHNHDDRLWNGRPVSAYDRTNEYGRPLSLAYTPQVGYNPAGNNNLAPMNRIDPRQALSTTDLPSQISRNAAVVGHYSHNPETSQVIRREPRSASPTYTGPAFSASNLESRQQLDDVSTSSGLSEGHGKPVAKVPPHKIAGVKVLPTNFKLPKRPASPKAMYRTNDDDLLWEKQNAQFQNHANNNNNNNNNVPSNRYSSHYPANNNYPPQQGGVGHINTNPNYNGSPAPNPEYYRNSSGFPVSQAEIYDRYYSNAYADGNQAVPERRYGGRGGGGGGGGAAGPADVGVPSGMDRRPHSYYEGEPHKVVADKKKAGQGEGNGENMLRKKEAEIASMFQQLEIQGGKQPMIPRYASQADLNFEQSLGYYP